MHVSGELSVAVPQCYTEPHVLRWARPETEVSRPVGPHVYALLRHAGRRGSPDLMIPSTKTPLEGNPFAAVPPVGRASPDDATSNNTLLVPSCCELFQAISPAARTLAYARCSLNEEANTARGVNTGLEEEAPCGGRTAGRVASSAAVG